MGALLRRVLLTVGSGLALAQAGCTYLQERGEDFLDVWRGDLLGPGLPGAWAHAGPLAHVGLGGPITPGICATEDVGVGWAYPLPPEGRRCGEGYFLLLHSADGDHRCFGILPFLTGANADRSPLHLCDLEVGANVLFFGIRAGFSPGEFLDFLLGWFGPDIARDDPAEERARRSLKGG